MPLNLNLEHVSSVPALGGRRRRILVVDDSRTALLVEKLILSRGRYEVVTAGTAQEALEAARRQPPDLIVMDVVMPGMTGLEACRALRQDPATRDIPVILSTTLGEAESMEAGFASGCADYVTKPVDAVELLAKVRSCLGES